MYKWNPEDYKKNSSNQYIWALNIISKLDLKGDEKILDIGCGDGKVSAEIASYVPKGAVFGIDNCKEMIEFSQKNFPPSNYPNLTFQEGDAKLLNFDNEFDWVVSFSCIHWVIDHKSVLEGIQKSLKLSGKTILQFPLFTPVEMSIIDSGQTMKTKKWSNYFDDLSWPCAFYEIDEYKDLLEKCGLKVKRVESKQTYMTFQGKEGLRGFIRSTLNAISGRVPEELRQEFIGDLVDKSVESRPPDSAGLIYLPFMSVEVEASKHISN